MSVSVPPSHPRYQSLLQREKIIEGCRESVVAPAGLIAHGRGEAFDYLLGETTPPFAREAARAAAAALISAERPVISVNGNAAALTAPDLVRLSELTGAPLEINLFYAAPGRLEAIEKTLRDAGGETGAILGTANRPRQRLSGMDHNRRIVDPEGIGQADTVLVPLEDGDRTEALAASGCRVITIDLNPLSRTAQTAHITIVDNLIRALPSIIREAEDLLGGERAQEEAAGSILRNYSNEAVLAQSLEEIGRRLQGLAQRGKEKGDRE